MTKSKSTSESSGSKSKSSSSKSRRKLKRKIDNFSNGVGISPAKLVILLVLTLGIGGYIIFTALTGKPETEKVAAPLTQQEKQRQELTIDQRLDDILKARVTADDNFLMVIEEMKDLEEKLEAVESSGALNEQQRAKVDLIRIRNKAVAVMTMVRNKVDCDAEKKDLVEHCQSKLDAADETLNEAAKFWLCVIPTVELVESPSEKTLADFSQAIQSYSEGFTKTPEHAATISRLIYRMRKATPTSMKFAKQGFSELAKAMEQSSVGDVRLMAQKLEGLALFGQFDLPTLSKRILWSDPTARTDLEGALDVLAANPDAGLNDWVIVIRSYESLLSTDKIEETGAAWQRVSDLCSQLPEGEKKDSISKILKRQKERALSIGTPFDASGEVLPEDRPFHPERHDYTAVIFCDKSKRSIESLITLGKDSRAQQLPYRPILAFEEELTEKDFESLHLVPKEIMIANHETAKKYYSAFPTDFFPYVVPGKSKRRDCCRQSGD